MIIFGTRGVTYGNEKGQFHCPGCGDQQSFVRKRVRRFFTLYFIPLIPLDLLAEYVECRSCRNTYKLDVLSWDPSAQEKKSEAEFHRAIRYVMVHMMIADGQIDDAEVETIVRIYAQVTGNELRPDEIRSEGDSLRRSSDSLEVSLARVAPLLNESGKELVIKAAVMVAAADGNFDEEEHKFLSRVAKCLEMSPAHFRGVLSSLNSPDHQ